VKRRAAAKVEVHERVERLMSSSYETPDLMRLAERHQEGTTSATACQHANSSVGAGTRRLELRAGMVTEGPNNDRARVTLDESYTVVDIRRSTR